MISVLYVDDEEALLDITKIFLEDDREFSVETARSAQEALSLPGIWSFDAIVSDYQMPGMDGIAFLKEVRRLGGDTPFILFTGRGREQVVIEAINNGADFYLQKGGDPEVQFAELAHKIRQAVRRKKAERSLVDSERRLADIIEFLPDATFAIDRSGTVIAWNRAIEEMTGIPATGILGTGDYAYAVPFYGSRRPILIDMIDGTDRQIAELYTNIFRAGPSVTAETDLPHPKGHRIDVLAKACHLYNRAGEVTGAIESIRDITALKQAGRELERQDERFRKLIQNASDMIRIIGPGGIVTYSSPSTLRITGYDPVSVAGTDAFGYVHPDDRERVKAAFAKVIAGSNAGEPTEYRIRRADGVYIDVEATAVNLLDMPGIEGVVTTTRPITERKRAEHEIRVAYEQIAASEEELRQQYRDLAESEQQVRASEQRLASIYNTVGDVIFQLTVEGPDLYRYSSINSAFCSGTGLSPDQVIGRLVTDVIPEPSLSAALEKYRQAIGERTIVRWEETSRFPRGEVTGEVSVAPVFDRKNRCTHLIGSIHDITERKRIGDALTRANRQLSLLSGVTRHDIVNKITVIRGLLRVAEKKYRDPGLAELLKKIESSTLMIHKEIEFTRVYRDLGTHEPQWIELASVMPGQAVPAPVSFRADVDGISVFADPLLGRVFSNLLDNSVRHGGRVTAIRVSSRIEGEDAVLVWEDDGVGIGAGEKDVIFERGYGKNTGLGMFLAREILSLTDLAIRETGDPGRGARFEISIPKGMWRRARTG